LNRGGARNPDVLLVAGEDDARLVVKDFRPRGALVRNTLGRWITAREVRAWRALDGHPAVPRYLGGIDALAFAVEYRPGRKMARKLAAELPPDFLTRLARAIEDMHERGVAHLDLRHRSNVLLDDSGAPVLIDFGSAVTFRPGGWPARLLLPAFGWLDRRALRKWQRKLAPG
jgi:RIO-like serine/threonine protein kinase